MWYIIFLTKKQNKGKYDEAYKLLEKQREIWRGIQFYFGKTKGNMTRHIICWINEGKYDEACILLEKKFIICRITVAIHLRFTKECVAGSS